MASILNKDPGVYVQEYENFLRELRKHHDQKGTSFRHLPSLNGKEIDLYLLYWLVTAQGGWEKNFGVLKESYEVHVETTWGRDFGSTAVHGKILLVNSENLWDDLLESFEIEHSTVNGSLALKQIYLRYLDSYEKTYFEDAEEEDRDVYYDEEDSRSRRHRQQKIVNSIPATYNEAQHKVSDTVRAHYGMSLDLFQPTDYDRLCLSLLSPLPNEQDFAINVATLLSNEGKHTLKLARCPRLLDLLCAHAGIFNHHSLRNYMDENYRDIRDYHQVQFWRDVCRNTAVLELIYDEKNFYPKPAEETIDFFKASYVTKYTAEDSSGRLEQMRKRVEEEVSDSDMELFAVGRSEGTREPNGQRVLQVATILRNISFEEDNVPVLAKNLTLLRFVLLCVNSSWSNLNQTGFDILSNIASEMQLEDPDGDAVTDLMMKTLARCIGDQDRFQVISSLDVLTKLCVLQSNEELVTRMVQSSVYRKLVDYLSLHDIHLLIATLECLYSLSNLGEAPCNSIVKTHSAIELLVSLVTVEAQSYGPKACILMRVVETVPQPNTLTQMAPPQPSGAMAMPQPQIPATPNQPTNVSLAPSHVQQPGGQSGSIVATTVTVPVAGGSMPVQPALPGGVQQQRPQMVGQPGSMGGPPPNITLPKHPLPLASTRPMLNQGMVVQQPQPPPQPVQPQYTGPTVSTNSGQPGNQQVQLKVSNDEPHRVFCLSWLKATYEPAPGKSIEQNIMYKQYLASMHRMGRREVISSQHYALCIRTLFGGTTGPNKKNIDGKVESHYTDIQVRAQPLPLKLTPAQAQAAQEASRQQQLQTPPLPTQPAPQQQIQQTLAAQKPIPLQSLPNQPLMQKPPIVQQSVIQPTIVRPGTPQQQTPPAAVSVQPPNSTGQVMQIVNQQGQIVQGQVVNATSTGPNGQQQVIQVINQNGQLVQVSGTQGQVIQQQPQPQQIIQNIVNAQGQVIQKRIITQPAGSQQVIIGGQPVVSQQQGFVRGPQPGQQVIVAMQPQGANGAPVMVQSQSGQVVQIQGGGQGQPVLLQGGQIVMQQGGQVVNSNSQQMIMTSGGQQMIVSSGGQPNMMIVSTSGQTITTNSSTPGMNNMVLTNSKVENQSSGGAMHNQFYSSAPFTTSTTTTATEHQSNILKDLLIKDTPPIDAQQRGNPEVIMENGISAKDSTFGSNDNLTELLNKNNKQPVMVNGVNNDYSKLNGDSMMGKRGPNEMDGLLPAAKKPAVENNGTPMTNGLPNGQFNGNSNGVKLVAGGQIIQNAGQGQPQIVQTSSGQFYLKASSANGETTMVPAQQVINQQGKAVLVFNQDQQQQLSGQQPQQIVKQVINTPSGQQIVRQVVVPSGTVLPSGQQMTSLDGTTPNHNSIVTTNGLTDNKARQTPPLTNGDHLSPSASPAPPSVSQTPPPNSSTAAQQQPPVKIDPSKPFLCEWAGCMKAFKAPKEVERHAIAEHCPIHLEGEDIPCLWARCDGLKRKRFSLMTHFQDRHCHPQLMKLMAVRRVQIAHNGKSDVPLPPSAPPHPGYAPNAALHAIKRHAQEFTAPKELELKDEKEGPVTKSIRLTASLILRNLVIYSPSGRLRIRAYESHLSTVALSNVESSRTVAQILYEMDNAVEFT